MGLFQRYLEKEAALLVEKGVRLSVIGRRDRISGALADAIRAAEGATARRDFPAPPPRRRLLRAGRHPSRVREPALPALHARELRGPARGRLRPGEPGSGRGSPHPDGGRASPQRLPPLGGRLRGALLHASACGRTSAAQIWPTPCGAFGNASAGSEGFAPRRLPRAPGTRLRMPAFSDPDAPFASRPRRLRVPREMAIAPPLDPAFPASRLARRHALLVNPFYPKDPHASFGKHVLTPTLALTSVAAATPPGLGRRPVGREPPEGPPPWDPLPEVVGHHRASDVRASRLRPRGLVPGARIRP